MCELIFKTQDNVHQDPAKDRGGSYKRGYPVSIHEDGWNWSETERGPAFRIVRIPGIPASEILARGLLQQEPDPLSTEETPLPPIRRRRFALDLDRWTTADDAALLVASSEAEKLAILQNKLLDLEGT